MARLRAAVEAAEAETAAVRAKLHSAIRKGKAIEAEKHAHSAQIQKLEKQLSSLQDAPPAQPAQPQEDSQQAQTLLEQQQQQQKGLQAQLKAAQQQVESLQQEAGTASEAHSRELARQRQESAAAQEHISKLDSLLKAQQRSAAALQGEVIIARTTAESYKQQAQDAQRASLQQQQTSADPADTASEAAELR